MFAKGFQPSFTGGEISPDLTMRVDLAKFQTACKTLENMLIVPHGGAYKRNGFRYVYEFSEKIRLMPFIFNISNTYMLCFGENVLYIATKDGLITNTDGSIYSIETPYTFDQANKLGFTQSADVIYLASHYHPPYKLSRRGLTDWTFEELTFYPKILAPSGLSATWYDNRTQAEKDADGPMDKEWKYRITAISETGEESLPSEEAIVLGPENMRNNSFAKLTWTTHADATEYRVYQEQSGSYGYIGSSQGTAFDAKNIAPDMLDSFPNANNPFTDGNYPGSVCFYQQRLVFAGTLNKPQTIYFSRSANYENFSTSTPLKADDAIEITIASNEVSNILWLVPLRTLLVGTAGCEYEVKGSGEAGAITPTGISVLPQSYRGSTDIDAQIVGSTVLHVSRSNKEVRDLLYDFGSDSYVGADRAILATHLFENNTIEKMAYQQSPDSIIYVIRDDGVLVGMTYLKEHDVYGWHRHTTQGKFFDVATIPSSNIDYLFVMVERVINGVTKYFLETQDKRIIDETGTTEAFFVDCGLTYRGDPADEILGLDHLSGEEVSILADGGVVDNQIVSAMNGGYGVKLPYEASVVHIGLPYTGKLQSMSINPNTQAGLPVAKPKQISSVGVYVRATNALKVGTDFDNMYDASIRSTINPLNKAPLPVTQEIAVTTSNAIRGEVYACCMSDLPVPLIVLAFNVELQVY